VTDSSKTFLDAFFPVIKWPYIIVSKIWGFEPNKLTPSGVSAILTDLVTLIISFMLIMCFPKEPTSESMIQYIGAVVLLIVVIYGFLPAAMRLLYGDYSQYVNDGEDMK
jgi:hypothetical protein